MDYANSRMSEVIDEFVHNARNRQILKDRYIDGMTFEKIAEKHNLSFQRVRSIIDEYKTKLFSNL